MSRPIAYEPHPVTPERKAELRAAGFKIVDAVFKPTDAPAEPVQAPAPKRSGKRAADATNDQQEA